MAKKSKPRTCSSCGCEIIFNKNFCKDLWMCWTCITWEARYNYEEVED